MTHKLKSRNLDQIWKWTNELTIMKKKENFNHKTTLKESPWEIDWSQNQAHMDRSTRWPVSCFSSITSLWTSNQTTQDELSSISDWSINVDLNLEIKGFEDYKPRIGEEKDTLKHLCTNLRLLSFLLFFLDFGLIVLELGVWLGSRILWPRQRLRIL